MTTPIARNPTRVFPQVIDELADKYGDAPALLSDRESFSYRELAARVQPLRALGAGAGPAQGRHGLPDDAEPAGIPGAVARRHARRRRGGAAQHPPHRRRARPLHQCREAEARHRRRRTARCAGERAHAYQRRSPGTQDLAAWRRRPPISRASTARSMAFPAARSRHRTLARSPSRIARSTSTPRARPACRRPPT